jgi:hypothetical protein
MRKMQKKAENPLRQVVEQTMDRLERYCDGGRGRQTQVAKALLVDPSQVCRWIQRGGYPRIETFCELIDFLDRQVQPGKESGKGDN